MPRAVSIHIGVNRPAGRHSTRPLQYSECVAWRMAGLAEQAGYNSLMVLRGDAATRSAVHEALTRAAGSLGVGDTLFVSFSGHGSQERDLDGDEGNGWDEGWCLADGVMVDDRLAGYWQLFERGVRIVVVADSCYSAGCVRGDGDFPYGAGAEFVPAAPVRRGGVASYRGAGPSGEGGPSASCIAECPADTHGIQASLLLLAASGEDQPARENLFARHLLDVWNDGGFRGSYCDLHRQVRERVVTEHPRQHPHILMLGASDPAFPLAAAFHLNPRPAAQTVVYR